MPAPFAGVYYFSGFTVDNYLVFYGMPLLFA
jgi:hypothetical protein